MAAQVRNAVVILRRRRVEERTGLSRSTIYEKIKAGTFPAQITLGGLRSVGWIESEIDGWLATQVDASRKGAA